MHLREPPGPLPFAIARPSLGVAIYAACGPAFPVHRIARFPGTVPELSRNRPD